MNNLLMLSIVRILLGLIFINLPNQASATSLERSISKRSLNIKKFNFVEQNDFLLSYIQEKQNLIMNPLSVEGRNFFEWVPDGSLNSAVPVECLPEEFEHLALKKSISTKDFATLTKDYFNRCGSSLSAHATNGLLGLLEFVTASYPYLENSRIKSITFSSKNGEIFNGFIGVKDQKPRPWVIFKCGVFCSASPENSSLKNYMIHLFDQTPFNVIFLGNRTGQDYIKANQLFSLGGSKESDDFFTVVHWLREESVFAKTVSSIHLVAVSLGGSAAFLAERKLSTYDNSSDSIVQSISSICAVSDLRPTVDDMYEDSIKGFIFSRLTWKHLTNVKEKLPNTQDLLGGERPSSSAFPNLLGRLATRFSGETINSDFIRFNEEDAVSKFWTKNHYSNRINPSKIPLFIWASEDDSVVNFNINTGTLIKDKSILSDSNTGIVDLPKGEHCGFGTAYGYAVVASVLRTFILNNSPEYSKQEQQMNFKLFLPNLDLHEKIISYWWSQNLKNSLFVNLNMEIYSSAHSFCAEKEIFNSPTFCRRIVKVEVKKEEFEYFNVIKPSNLIEEEAMIRELNARISLFSHNNTIVGTKYWPDQIVFRF